MVDVGSHGLQTPSNIQAATQEGLLQNGPGEMLSADT
jgi:hypothetical protein